MTKKIIVIIALVMTLFTGCSGKNNGGDIEAAYQTVKDYFSSEFDGCTLTKLYYPGDTYADEFSECAEQYDADEAIVIFSSFDVDSSGGDGSLEPDSTYDDWMWTLIRNDCSTDNISLHLKNILNLMNCF